MTDPGPQERPARWLPPALLAGAFLYVWGRLNPGALFETTSGFPAFAPTADFAAKTLLHPGGPLEYLSAWLAQWFFVSWLAALILTAAAATVTLLGARLWTALAGRCVGWPALLPGTLTLVLYNQWEYHLGEVMAVAVALLAAGVYARRRAASPGVRAAWFVGLALVLYHLIGAPALLFVGLCAIMELSAGGLRLLGLLYVLSAEALPQLVGVVLWHRLPARAFTPGTPLDTETSLVGRIALGVLWVALLVLTAWSLRPARPPRPAVVLSRALAIAVLVLPVALACPRTPGLALFASAALREGQYERVLALARRGDSAMPALRLVHAANQALWHLDRWREEAFHYPQGPEGLMLGTLGGPGLDPRHVRYMRRELTTGFDYLEAALDLGLVNPVEREASELLETEGPHARTLRMLARVNLVKGRPAVARHYLLALERTPWGRARARRALAALQADPTLAQEPEIQRLRAAMPASDVPEGDLDIPGQCRAVLERDPTSRRAFETLVAFYLYNRDLERFAPLMERLPELGYTGLPRPWQEALVIRQATTQQAIGLPGYVISGQVYSDFDRYAATLRPYERSGRSRDAQPVLRKEFGNTYFYFHTFGESGAGPR